MSQSRHYDVRASQMMRESFVKEKRKRYEWKESVGRAYERANERIDARDTKQRNEIMIQRSVPQNLPGAGLILPVINYPKKKESEIMKNIRLQRQLEEKYGNAQTVNINNMKKVDPALRKSMYNGLSHNEEGVYRYLQTRKHVIPEEKYTSPIVSSWEYGWNLWPHMHKFGGSEHARNKVVQQSFYRNGGVINPPNEAAGLSQAM